MNFHRAGTGEPLVLIHGLGSRWQVWRPVLPLLTAHYDVIAVDLPGFGLSPASNALPFPDAVVELLDSLGVRRPRMAGSSLGGGVALELGRRGVAAAVAAFSPTGFFGPAGAAWCRASVGGARFVASVLDPLLPWLMTVPAGRIALCGLFYGHPAALSPGDCVADARALVSAVGFAAASRGIGRWRLKPAHPDSPASPLDGIPVTIAWGTRDLVLPRWQAARARTALPRARHVALTGCGHLPFADDPQGCARLLLDRP